MTLAFSSWTAWVGIAALLICAALVFVYLLLSLSHDGESELQEARLDKVQKRLEAVMRVDALLCAGFLLVKALRGGQFFSTRSLGYVGKWLSRKSVCIGFVHALIFFFNYNFVLEVCVLRIFISMILAGPGGARATEREGARDFFEADFLESVVERSDYGRPC